MVGGPNGSRDWTLQEWRDFCQQLRDTYGATEDPDIREAILEVLHNARGLNGWPSGALL